MKCTKWNVSCDNKKGYYCWLVPALFISSFKSHLSAKNEFSNHRYSHVWRFILLNQQITTGIINLSRIRRFWNTLTHLVEVSNINQFQLQIQRQARNLIVRQEHFAVQRLSSAPRQSKFSSPSSLPSEPWLLSSWCTPSPPQSAMSAKSLLPHAK